jgi:tRNA threonylcarbamoyladenosine biosynthesis protein TsaE
MSSDFAKKGKRHRLPKQWLETGESWTLVTHSAEETKDFGAELAKQISPPCVILLEGELGAGKTTLTKGIVQGLGAAREEDVTSPSFALVHEYGVASQVYHIDLYRIESPMELATLGLDEILGGDAIVLIEWGEKFGSAMRDRALRVRLEYAGNDNRKITVESANTSP